MGDIRPRAGRENESMGFVLRFTLVTLTALALSGTAHAAGGSYTFEGGTGKERAQVRAALEASAFPWDIVPAQITIHIARGNDSHALPGHIWLDADLLRSGRFAWGTVQHEYAHQVDFFLFDDATRARLLGELGGRDWCYGVPGLDHADYGCERFASTLAWAYWPSADNALEPESSRDESAALAPAKFRSLLAELLGARSLTFAKRTTRAGG